MTAGIPLGLVSLFDWGPLKRVMLASEFQNMTSNVLQRLQRFLNPKPILFGICVLNLLVSLMYVLRVELENLEQRAKLALIGFRYDENSSFMKGAADAPPHIRGAHLRKLFRMQPTLLLGICLLGVVSGGNVVGARQAQAQSAESKPQWKDPTTLRARVEREKAKGVRKVMFPAPLMEYADEISLETAIAQTTTVVADVLEKQSRLVDSHTIATFYKLGIIEKLSDASPSAFSPKDQSFPTDLPPLGPNEIYFAGIGGTIMLDDIEVTVREDFEDLQVNGRYLFFLSVTESGKFSLGRIGPRGVFTVAGDGHLDSRLRQFKLGQELEAKTGNSLTKLKDLIQKQKRSIN